VALVLTFPCGRCGKKYSIYYPKAFIYSVYGTGTRARGERDVSQQAKITCTCGKNLDLNLANHPRVPERKRTAAARQTGMIAFPSVPKKPAAPPS